MTISPSLNYFLFFLLYSLVVIPAFSQGEYRKVDSIMRDYKEKIRTPDDLYKVVYFMRQNFVYDSLRLRASVIWITENIDYDVEAFLKEDLRAAQLDYVLKKKKAICSGYASLLKYFCDVFNIECDVITGYARTGRKGIVLNQVSLFSNHAWNAVKINDRWRLIDPTWAAGYVDDSDEENQKYVKEFNETYYFTDPERLIFNHLPRHSKYQFLLKPVPEPIFKKWPLVMSGFLNTSIQKADPDTSLVRLAKGDTLTVRFRFAEDPPYYSLCVYTKRNEKERFVAPLIKAGAWYEFSYPVTMQGYYDIYISDCRRNGLVAYRLEVK